MGSGFASFMILAIKKWGWRSMYYIAGSVSLTLATLTFLFVKNPIVPSDSTPKISEEEEDRLLNKNIAISK